MRHFLRGLALAFLFLFGSCAVRAELAPPTADSHPFFRFKGEVRESTVKDAIEFIREANKGQALAIVVEIDTNGGNVDAGIDLAMEIERSAAPVYCVVDNSALSMGFVLFEVCNIRILTKHAGLMAHEIWVAGMVEGGRQKFADVSEMLSQSNRRIAERLAPRLEMTVDAFLDRIARGEWWMNWGEALKAHATDYVVDNFAEARALAINLSAGP